MSILIYFDDVQGIILLCCSMRHSVLINTPGNYMIAWRVLLERCVEYGCKAGMLAPD
jgi:hypothetical protein